MRFMGLQMENSVDEGFSKESGKKELVRKL